jgi:hypothetical protein
VIGPAVDETHSPDEQIVFSDKDAASEACFAHERPRTPSEESISRQATSLSFWASASDCSFFSD